MRASTGNLSAHDDRGEFSGIDAGPRAWRHFLFRNMAPDAGPASKPMPAMGRALKPPDTVYEQ